VVVHARGVSFYLDAVLFEEFEEVPLLVDDTAVDQRPGDVVGREQVAHHRGTLFADTTAPLGVGKTAPTAFFFMASG